MDTSQFGQLIKARRKELQVPQEELSALSGVSERTIRDLEQGRLSVSFEKIVTLLDVLGLKLEVVEQ